MSNSYHIIIIGAGIMGGATAYSLSKTDKKVLLLEQFPLLHSKGSSHGQSRIIHQTYTEKHFSDLMKTSYTLWSDFEYPHFPIFIAWEDQPFYGFPLIERTNSIKIAPHFTTNNAFTPNTRDDKPNSYMIDQISDFIDRNFNYANNIPIDSQTCYYSMTNDENFILDFHPDSKK